MTEPPSNVPPLPMFPHAGAATHSRRPAARRRFNLSIDTTDHRHRRVGSQNGNTPSTTTQSTTHNAKTEIQLTLLRAKTLLDYAPTSLQKYNAINKLARQAHAQALALQDTDLTARCCFYLGECELPALHDGERHVIRANELYTRCTLCTDELAVEPALASQRLEELARMFPTSALSVASEIRPLSALPASGARRTSDPNTAENLVKRATAHAQKRNYTRVPSFGSTASDVPSPAQSATVPASESVGKLSPAVTQRPASSAVLQMMLGAYQADYNSLSPMEASPVRLFKKVTFSNETSDSGESGKEISRRRKLSRTLTMPRGDVEEQDLRAGIPPDVVDTGMDEGCR